jgi:hypothetical protein
MSGARQVPVRGDGQYVDVWVAQDGAMWRAWAEYRGQHVVAKGGLYPKPEDGTDRRNK